MAELNKPTLVEEEDDDSSVASSPFDDGGFLDSLDSVGGAAGDSQESSSAAVSAVVEGHPFSPGAATAATATTEATTAPDEPPDLSVAGPSMSSGEQHGYQLRRRIPQPPNAFMLFAMENRRSVAAENPNEDNQRVSTRLGKLWRSLSAAAKESYQRKAAVAAAIHRIKYPGYVYNPREAHRRKEQARIAKAIASKVKQEPSDDQELEAQSTSASLGPSTPALQNPPRLPQSPPPLPLQLRRWATTATLASTQADARTTPTGRSTAAAPSTTSAGPVARPYCRLRRAPPPPLRRVGTVTTCEPPTTYPLNQLSSLAALSRDGAAVRLHVAPFAEQPEQQRNTATATRRAPTGTAMPNMASRQQRIAGSRWRFTEAATSSAVEATLCSPATAQATQHQDMGGPFQPCELAVSHAITSLPYAYSTQPVHVILHQLPSVFTAQTGFPVGAGHQAVLCEVGCTKLHALATCYWLNATSWAKFQSIGLLQRLRSVTLVIYGQFICLNAAAEHGAKK
ncbi:hypothetical protein HPB51_029044 [Rhipicephalus microplus]|uniref:Sex-determining region Y protein n=1 Tax=Rhipicephalus microplus TaxID=6941 RepID=A0A9J6CV87_RHIMP|nr:hypothetical protein HPB51_029044 [Rhipicephalus microplus]